ncbi:signal peptidase I [Kordiimonas sp. SCSIO 12603]|uniref:signal peptidase I n=1 Tax=Kordiimonas sp. SCSIO 12603 TaxID=2829596 RepID=UPI00210368F4|nr:signal peptidase I [Kordiimonas sp. SCSIO 12603]UTW58275.1 signal peptidase I [Kordiimonas sp. SCSIO 12603]
MIAVLFSAALLLSDTSCEITTSSVTGNSMQGILWDKQAISIRSMGCEGFKRYDHLVFTHEETPNAIIKQLWGFPGDTVTVHKDGSFSVNGEKAVTPFKRTYKLLGAYKTRLKKMETEGPLKGYLVLGHPGSLDSARVGLISEGQILGWVSNTEPLKE